MQEGRSKKAPKRACAVVDNLLKRDALEESYERGSVSTTNSALRLKYVAIVKAMLKELPDGLANNEHCMSLRRACNSRCGVVERKPYTHKEQQEAAYAFTCKGEDHLTRAEVLAKYGICRTSLKWLKATLLGKVSTGRITDARLRREADTLDVPQGGQQPLLLESETALLLSRAAQRGDMGHGLNPRLVRHETRLLCQSIAQHVPDPKAANKLEAAVISDHWLRDNERKVAHLLVHKGSTSGFLKASAVSEKRAAATATSLTLEMFRKLREAYANIHLRKILKQPLPTADQIFNMDEVGYDGNGKHGRVFVTKDGERKFQVVSGERGPFWVTQVLWSCANGTANIVPTVIHEGATLSSYFTKNLPDNWVVHATPSGVLSRHSMLFLIGVACPSVILVVVVALSYTSERRAVPA